MDEFLRVLVTKNIEEGQSAENHPEHGPSSVKEARSSTYRKTVWWLTSTVGSGPRHTLLSTLAPTLPANLTLTAILESQTQVQPGTQETVEGDADTLKHVPDVYALGDCCSPVETPLPALAQVSGRSGGALPCMDFAALPDGTNSLQGRRLRSSRASTWRNA